MKLDFIGQPGTFRLAWLAGDDDVSVACEFFLSRSRPEKDKTVACFEHAKFGPPRRSFKALKGDMNGFYELRPTKQITYFCFRHGDIFIITNGCFKRKDCPDEKDKRRAHDLKSMFVRDAK